MNSKELLSLADRCEAAIEPDRTLDREIAFGCGWHRLSDEYGASAGHWVSPGDWKRKQEWDGWTSSPHLPRFTESLDAAVTLFADGGEFNISTIHGVAHVEYPLNISDGAPSHGRHVGGVITLAICSAALRERATTLFGDNGGQL